MATWNPEPEASRSKPVAVIDIGTNSVRMVIAQMWPDGRLEELERVERAVALGHDTFVTDRLSQQTMNTAIAILRDYRRMLDTYGVEAVRAVATSAVREADNGDAFVDRVAMAVDIDLEVLATTEESRLSASALRVTVGDALDLGSGRALIVDVGGGSTLLTVLDGGVITASVSYAVGSIRLQEYLASTREPRDRAMELLRHRIASVVNIVGRTMPLDAVRWLLAVGEDAQFAAKHAGRPLVGAERVSMVEQSAFERLVSECARQTPAQVASCYGLPLPTAVRLMPALLIYRALLHASSAEEMVVCSVSMRDGLLLDMARRVTGKEDPELAESIVRSAKSVGAKYRVDERHAAQVADLAVRLFDELAAEHGLGPRHRLLLRVAGVLHEVGKFVSNRAHHKHCYYLIAHAEVYGLSRREIEMVAHVARYHRRSAPKKTHLDYMTLPREDRIAVSKLASLLRVADALDRGHQQHVRELSFQRRPGEFIIYVGGAVDLTLERQAMAEKADLFEETFGMRARLEEAAAPLGDGRRASPVE